MQHIQLFVLVLAVWGSRKLDVQISYIDAPLINIHWCQDTVLTLTSKGSVYRSEDRGRQWVKMSEVFHRKALVELGDSEERVGIVNNIVPSPIDKKLILFTGSDQIAWISLDCGKTISVINSGRMLREFQMHPTEKDWILASAWNYCTADEMLGPNPCVSYKELLLSQDTGITWHSLASYISQFQWGVRTPEMVQYTPKERILVAFEPQGKGHQSLNSWNIEANLYYSDDFFASRTLTVAAGSRFLLTEHYLFVAKVTSALTQEVSLLVSGTEWGYDYDVVDADSKLMEHSYTILDTSENQVFMIVNHLKPSSLLGVIYISDSTGTRYSRSLENAVRYDTGSEFYRVQGLEGIYLANVYSDEQARIYTTQVQEQQEEGFMYGQQQGFKDEDLKKYKQTRITLDKGGQWIPLKAPTVDCDGKAIVCTKCQLHLHLSQSFYQFAPIYTQSNSIGIIVATGSVGKYLSYRVDQVNTYLSRDGGLSWVEIKKGSYIYEISNHGGLIVMAKDQEATNTIVYSWDEGLNWHTFEFTEQKVEVSNIITESSNKATRFIVYGTTKVESNGVSSEQGILATIDLDDLHTRDCIGQDTPGEQGSDYELWTPSGLITPDCLFGKKVTYLRRKRESQCYNPDALERIISVESCPCSAEDYECDIGFILQQQQCVPINGTVNANPPNECVGYYSISGGYRKIAGDMCAGGVEHNPIRVACPNNASSVYDWIMILCVLAAIYWVYTNQDIVKSYLSSRSTEQKEESKQDKLLKEISRKQQQQQQQQQFKPIDLEENDKHMGYQEFDEDLLEKDERIEIGELGEEGMNGELI